MKSLYASAVSTLFLLTTSLVAAPQVSSTGLGTIRYCPGFPFTNNQIQSAIITPKEPALTQALNFNLVGFFNSKVTAGARINVSHKFGLMQFARQQLDLCEAAGKFGRTCPLSTGYQNMLTILNPVLNSFQNKDVTIRMEAYNGDNSPLFCFETDIELSL